MGINAPWGAGKTSFMNMMKEELRNNTEKRLILDFNPWLYASEKDLISVFFDELSKVLKRYDLSLAKNIIDYSALLSAFDTQETKIAASIIRLKKTDSSLQEKKKQISKSIKRIQKQMFVFIDDLDRLDADELLEMMKLIRNISDFPYMYYIAAYDKAYLVECLEKRMKTKEIDFAEKIFQVELQPLEGPKLNLHIELFRMLNKYIAKTDKIDFDKFLNWCRDSYVFKNVFSNIREVKRLANSFLISYEYLKDKVNVNDLLILELFQIKFPLAFLYFAKNRDLFFEDDNYYKRIIVLDVDNSTIFENNLKRLMYELRINESDFTEINNIIHLLFPVHDSEFVEARKSICEVNYFENYFVPVFSETSISLNDFNSLLKSDNMDSIQDLIAKWSLYKEISLRKRLKEYRPSNSAEQKTLIKVLFFTLFINVDGISGQEITDRIQELRKYNNNEEYSFIDRQFLMDIFLEKYNIQICQYLYSIANHYEQYELNYPFRIDEINMFRIEQFKKCIDMYQNDFKELLHCFIFMIDSNYWYNYVHSSFTSTIHNMIKSHASKNISSFASAVIVKDYQNSDTNDGKFFINRIPSLLWGSIDEFHNAIRSIITDGVKPVIDELKGFITEYKKNDLKSIQYNFQHIRPLSLKFQDFFNFENGKNKNSMLLGKDDYEIWEYILDQECYNETYSQNSFIEVFYTQKKILLVESELNKLLTSRDPKLNAVDNDTALYYDHLGDLYIQLNDYQKALTSFSCALKIRLDVLGKNHPDIAISYEKIGGIYYNKGLNHEDEKNNYKKAMTFFKKAYDVLQKHYPSDSSTKWALFHIQKTEEKIDKLEKKNDSN